MRCSMGGNGKPPKGWSPPLLLSEVFEGKSCGKTQRARGILAIELERTPPTFRLLALHEVSENDPPVSNLLSGTCSDRAAVRHAPVSVRLTSSPNDPKKNSA